MDRLGGLAYKNGKSLLVYKDEVQIPPLGMVDDIIVMAMCGINSIKTNSIINSFVESKKLKFGESKCKKYMWKRIMLYVRT